MNQILKISMIAIFICAVIAVTVILIIRSKKDKFSDENKPIEPISTDGCEKISYDTYKCNYNSTLKFNKRECTVNVYDKPGGDDLFVSKCNDKIGFLCGGTSKSPLMGKWSVKDGVVKCNG